MSSAYPQCGHLCTSYTLRLRLAHGQCLPNALQRLHYPLLLLSLHSEALLLAGLHSTLEKTIWSGTVPSRVRLQWLWSEIEYSGPPKLT